MPYQDVLGVTTDVLSITEDVLGILTEVLSITKDVLGIIVDVPCLLVYPLLYRNLVGHS